MSSLLFLHECKTALPKRLPNAHKGDFGHVLIIGGDYGMPGSVRMAGEAALRTGAGLLTLATRPEHAYCIGSSDCPELMAFPITKASDLDTLFSKATVIIIGPGLGQSTWGKSLFHHALTTKLPLVVDADGLKLLASQPKKRENWVLTPHPGEASILLKTDTKTIQSDRVLAVSQLQQKFEGVIVLKGQGSLVLGPTNVPFISEAGNPGMATAGMGDILSGVIAGLMAQGLSPEDAAKLGVIAHATAGDLASKLGQRGLKATDLLPYIRHCLND